MTSDNPVLILGSTGGLRNHIYREQFNVDNKIIIPLDNKHCCILTHGMDKNGISIHGKVFYNKIERIDVDCSFSKEVNDFMLMSADKFFFGSEKYLKGFFTIFKLV
jgi:hypothetical protein